MRPESTHAGHRVSWPALVALILVPLLAVASLITLGSGNNDDRVSAAVVNLDQAVELDGQTVPLGRQLAGAILEREGDNIGWALADANSAKDGLASGKYAAVVTIPQEFSAAATSFSANDADVARQATVSVQVSDNAPVTDAAVAQEIARLAADTINSQLTSSYLDNIYIGFNQVADQFTTIVAGAEQLNDGATKLAGGTGELSTGATQLAEGLGVLSDNSSQIVGGGEQLADGASQLAGGANQLAGGTSELASGASQLATGVAGVDTGASGLASGASELATGASGLATGIAGVDEGASGLATGASGLATGASKLATGSSDLASGASQLNKGVAEFAKGTPKLAKGVDDLAVGAKPLLAAIPGYTEGTKLLVGGVAEIKGGIDQVIDGLDVDADTSQFDPLVAASRNLANGAVGIDQGAKGISSGINAVDQQLQGFASGQVPPPAQVLAGLEQVKANFACPLDLDTAACVERALDVAFLGGFQAGTGVGSAALNTPDPQTNTSLKAGAAALASNTGDFAAGADQLADGIALIPGQIEAGTEAQLGELAAGLQLLSDGAGTAVTKAQPLVDNADLLGNGATELLGGIDELNTQVALLPAGVAKLAAGSSQLSTGASQLSGGTSQLAGGATQLSDGASQLAGGTSQLSDGASQLADGTSQLADGAGQLAGGTSQLSTGASQLASGASQLSDGAGALGSGTTELSGGVSAFIDGVRQYTGGVDSGAGGMQKIADGVLQLDGGAEQLAEGTDTFATELAKGADQVPTYTPEARQKLSTVVTSPVAQSNDLIGSGRAALVALVLVAVLWLTSLAAFVVARPVPSDVLTSSSSNVTLWGRTVGAPMALTAALGLVFGFMGGMTLDLSFGRVLGLMALMAALGVLFVLVSHALTAWLGNVGRGIAVLLLALSVALGLTSATPGVLDAFAGISPVHNGLLLVRTWVSDGSGLVGLLGGMLLVAAVALILSVLSISSRRKLSAAEFRSRVASNV